MLRYWMNDSTSIEQRSSVAATSAAMRAQELDVLVEQVVLEVADDEAELDLGRVARDHDRMDVALALLRRLR